MSGSRYIVMAEDPTGYARILRKNGDGFYEAIAVGYKNNSGELLEFVACANDSIEAVAKDFGESNKRALKEWEVMIKADQMEPLDIFENYEFVAE